ncbi:long-chain fatty acid--CoA ligase [Alistipes sp. AF48-12]|uniref:AMP-binding protein n=1 Tax=Alistipes sp. AF48-12 TaxID=2291998 RepID=UPI000E4F5E4B|nr:AMP-binding protein [Alistipes sp. AF48-12]RHO71265.1 long-chain fatty acid--CoA ligase [Alistipes sp. AF48-12]
MMFNTLLELYQHSIHAYSSNKCFSMYGGEALTYRDFADRVDSLIETFVASGLSHGDKIALLSNNMPNWGAAYFAAAISGMVIVPILPDFSGAEIDRIILHSEAKALVASDKLYTKVSKEVIAQLQVVIRSMNLGVISSHSDAPRGTIRDPKEEDLAAIIYTSGTTSRPKGVMLSHKNLCSELAMVSILQPVYQNDAFLSILPLSHTYECSLGMLLPFMWGASVIYLDKAPTAAVLLPILKEVRPTIMLSVPLIIEKIYKNKILRQLSANRLMRWLYRKEWGRKWLHRIAGKKLMKLFGGRIRFFGIGGAKLDGTVERFLFEGKFPYAIGYGLTETAPVLAGVNPSMVRHQSTGPMLEGVQARLDNVNPQSGEGEIVVKGPNVMIGYYKDPEATADSFTSDGWFRTKDLGLFDQDGYLYIKGRLSNMILGPSGENIYPEEIENVLNSHALVNDSLVREDNMGKLVAIVYFNREELERKYKTMKEELGIRMENIKHELLTYVNSKVNRFSKISTVIEQKDEFEKTPTHKIKRFLYNKKQK